MAGKKAADIFDEGDDVVDEQPMQVAQLSTNTPSISVPDTRAYDIQKAINDPIKAAAVGMGQGITMGGGDEALAYIGSKATDRPYEEIRDELRGQMDQMETDQPVASTLGQFAGGFALPVGPLARMAKPAAEGVKGVEAMTKALTNLGLRTTEGAALGGGYALGRSEADLAPNPDLPIDANMDKIQQNFPTEEVMTGAKWGAGVPMTIAGVQGGAKALGKLGELTPGVRSTIEAFREGKKGYKVYDKDITALRTIKMMQRMYKKVSSRIGEEGQKLEAILHKAGEDGKTVSPQAIDTALEEIQKIRGKRTTDKVVNKELDTLEEYLKDIRLGKEVEQVTPASTKVIPGEYNPSSEEQALKQLQDKMTMLKAAEEAGQPQAQAQAKLKERFADDQLEKMDEPFAEPQPIMHTETRTDPATGMSGLKVYDVKTMKPMDQQVMQNATPGEIQTFDIEGKKVMGMLLPNGKFYGRQVGDEAASTGVSFKTTPEKTEMVRAGAPETLSPLEAQDVKSTLQQMTGFGRGEAGLKTPEARGISNQVARGIRDETAEIAPQYQEQLDNISTLKGGLEDADLVAKAKTREMGDKLGGKKLFREAAKSTGEGAGAAEAKFDMREFMKTLKSVAPELADEIGPKMAEQTKRFGLSQGIRETPLQSASPSGLAGSMSSLFAQAGGVTGYATRKIERVAKNVTARFGYGPGTEGLVNKLNKLAYNKDMSTQARNALIFSIAQDPASREMLREVESDFEEGEDVTE